MRGILSVITIAHHVIRDWMMMNHRIGKPVHCLCMSVRDALPIKRQERRIAVVVIVVYVLKDFFALLLEVLVLVVRCLVSFWRIFLSCHGRIAWRYTHRRLKKVTGHEVIGCHRTTILIQQAVQRQNMKLLIFAVLGAWPQKGTYLRQWQQQKQTVSV